MTENEAIERIKHRISAAISIAGSGIAGRAYEDMEMALKALEEVQQYREIGTLEECRAAVRKQKTFKPKTKKLIWGVGRCKCGAEFLNADTNYCGNCGQKLKWSDEE